MSAGLSLNTYMNTQTCSYDQAWKAQPVANLFHQLASRAEGWRRDIRPAIIIHDATDDDINYRDDSMTKYKGPCIESGVSHLGRDREKCRYSAISHEERRNSIHSRSEGWSVKELIIRDPVTVFRCCIGAVLDADADGHGKD